MPEITKKGEKNNAVTRHMPQCLLEGWSRTGEWMACSHMYCAHVPFAQA